MRSLTIIAGIRAEWHILASATVHASSMIHAVMDHQLLEDEDVRGSVLPWDVTPDSPLLAAWLEVLARAPETQIFSHPEWLRLAAAAGVPAPGRVLVISHDDRPIGIFPLLRAHAWHWELSTFFTLDTAIAVVDPAAQDQAWAGLSAWLRRQPGAGLLALGPWGAQEETTFVREAAITQGLHVRTEVLDPSYEAPLPESWGAFLRGLGKATRDKLREVENYQAKHPGAINTGPVTDTAQIDVAITELVRLYRQRWGHQVGGSLLCDPRNAAFFRQMIHWAVARGYGALIRVAHGEQTRVVGVAFHLPGQRRAYYYTVARDLERHEGPRAMNSPGIILVAEIIRWAIERGAAVLVMGRGTAFYKERLGARPVAQYELTLASSALAGAVLPAVSRAVHVLHRLPVHLSYHARRILKRAQTAR